MKLEKLKTIVALTITSSILGACTPENLHWVKYKDSIITFETTTSYCLAKGEMGAYLVYGTYPLFGKDLKAGQCALFMYPFKGYYRIKNLVDNEPSLVNDPKALSQIKSQEEVIKKLQLNLEDL